MNRYQIKGTIGEGAHGVVYKAASLDFNQNVALKLVNKFKGAYLQLPLKTSNEEVNINLFREIKILQQIEPHDNIVQLLDVFIHGSCFVLCFQLMLIDLTFILKVDKEPLTESQIKRYTVMLLKGIHYCHSINIMHRDLKPSNLLIAETKILKIGDFGLTRTTKHYSTENRTYSHQVATRWYRAPELLYGSGNYDIGIDLWAVGCIIAEMFNKSPIFKGENDIDQLCTVISTMGTPDKIDWPQLENLPDYNKITFPKSEPISMQSMIPQANTCCIDLISNFLRYNPRKRITTTQALIHDWFFSLPLPEILENMPDPKNYTYHNPSVHQTLDFNAIHKVDHLFE